MMPSRSVLFLVTALTAAGCSPIRAIEALDVLRDLAAGQGPSALKRATPAPRRIAIRYCAAGAPRAADLYTAGTVRAGLVLVPGVAEVGKDDPRLVAFANTLARARFAVLVPDIASLRALHVRPRDAREIAGAVRRLSGADGTAVGVVAISYAAGPAILAALEDDMRGKIRFILAIGGYYDMEAVVTFFTTGYHRDRPGGKWRYRRPNAYGKWVFVKSNAGRFDDPRDRAALTAMARRKMRDLNADVGDLVARLGPEGKSLHALLRNRDPDAVSGLIAALPRRLRDDLAGLDLSRRDLSRLTARLYLIHGRDDAIIPATESRALRAAAPEGGAALHIVDSLGHADIGPSGVIDTLSLWNAVYALLGERDRMTPPITVAKGKPSAVLQCQSSGSGV